MIIVETGSIVPGANSFVSRADYIAYAAGFGIVIPDNESADIELINAGMFINGQECIKGTPVSRDQTMAFPRRGVKIDGWEWSDTEIPRQVILCQMQLALDIHAGIDLWNPPQVTAPKKSTRIEGAVAVTYAVSDVAPSKLSRVSKSQALLNAFLCSGGFIMSVPLVRA